MMSYGHARVEPTFPAFQALQVPALLLKSQDGCLNSAQLSKATALKWLNRGTAAIHVRRRTLLSPIRRVTFSRSKNSESGITYFRLWPTSSLKDWVLISLCACK